MFKQVLFVLACISTAILPGAIAQSYAYSYNYCEDAAYLGISYEIPDADKVEKLSLPAQGGSYVTNVVPESPAAKSGLMPFDYIYGIDSKTTAEDKPLSSLLKAYKPGEEASLLIIRKGEKQKLPIVFGQKPYYTSSFSGVLEKPFLGVTEKDGYPDETGVRVGIVAGSSADKMGLKADDLITHIDGYPILDWQDIRTAVQMQAAGTEVEIAYVRDGKKGTAQGRISSRKETSYEGAEWAVEGTQKELLDKARIATEKAREKLKELEFELDGMRVYRRQPEGDEVPHKPIDISKATIAMDVIEREEADRFFAASGIPFPATNTLALENLKFTPDTGTGKFILEGFFAEKGNTSVQVYNSAGRSIYQYDISDFSGVFSDTIDLAQNGAGVYYLLIKQGEQIFAQKLTLQ